MNCVIDYRIRPSFPMRSMHAITQDSYTEESTAPSG